VDAGVICGRDLLSILQGEGNARIYMGREMWLENACGDTVGRIIRREIKLDVIYFWCRPPRWFGGDDACYPD